MAETTESVPVVGIALTAQDQNNDPSPTPAPSPATAPAPTLVPAPVTVGDPTPGKF